MKIQRTRIMSPTGKPVIVPAIHPNVGVQTWYQRQLDMLIDEMYQDARIALLPAIRDTAPVIVGDEAIAEVTEPMLAAGVVFQVGQRVLLLRRSDGGMWALPGGGVEFGEDPETTARRECFEEMRFKYDGPLQFFRVQPWRNVLFSTFVAKLDAQFTPRLNHEHTAYCWVTLTQAMRLGLHPGVRSTFASLSSLAMDAGSPTKQLQRAMEKWGDKWMKRFDLMSNKLSVQFATKAKEATQIAMMAAFKRAGFTIKFRATRASLEAYKVVAAEQVGLIKSIPQKFLTDVQTKVWQSVKRGADMKTLSEDLRKTYGITKRRAALIARDQNMKAKSVIEAERHQEIGIKQAIWMHSHAGAVPRPTHLKMNNKLYNLAQGMYDSAEERYVHPGELINCRCSMRPFIPGFETSFYPEWEIAQT